MLFTSSLMKAACAGVIAVCSAISAQPQRPLPFNGSAVRLAADPQQRGPMHHDLVRLTRRLAADRLIQREDLLNLAPEKLGPLRRPLELFQAVRAAHELDHLEQRR